MAVHTNLWAGFMAQPRQVQIAYTILVIVVIVCRRKVIMWLRGVLFFILWGEKKGMSKHRDPKNVVAPKNSEVESKIIIFIRHGESDWNYIFNKNKLLLLPRLVMGFVWEMLMFLSNNSLFIDSALSSEGVDQAKELQKFIAGYSKKSDTPEDFDAAMRALQGAAGALPSLLVTSNLRRAIATGCIALWPRLLRTKERTIVLSSLQEMSRNVDTTALAGPRELPEMPTTKEVLGKEFQPELCLDASQSKGSKGFKRKAVKSMEEFNAWCFQQPQPVIIVNAGHSLWFKNFFKVYLPKSVDHHSKDLKMVNCGVVAFNLEKGVLDYDKHQTGFRVDANSITTLYGGFEKLKKANLERGKLKLPNKSNGSSLANPKLSNGGKDESGSVMGCCTSRD